MTTTEGSGVPSGTASKYVYHFGDGQADGSADMRNLLGGKGAGLAEMTNLGIPVPPGFTITTEVCTAFYEQRPPATPTASRTRCARASRFVESLLGRRFGDPERPAARLGALRRARLDARHDGHHPQPRPQRRDRRGPGARDRRRALRLRLLPPLRRDVRRRRARPEGARPTRTTTRSRRILEAKKHALGVELDTELHADGAARSSSPSSRRDPASARGIDFPEDPWEQLWGAIGAVFGSWENPRAVTYRRMYEHPRRLGHRRQRPGDGLRQPGRRLRHRRRLHARPVDRREPLLRRVPGQRPGRGRRRRHPHAAADHAARRKTDGQTVARRGDAARPTRELDARLQAARAALPRHAGHRVHDPAGPALAAADPQRQAHRPARWSRSPSTWCARA